MANNTRRKTTGANSFLTSKANSRNQQSNGRRQTTTNAASRPFNTAPRQLPRIEKQRDVQKKEPVKPKSNYDAFQEQLDDYKIHLVTKLNDSLVAADAKIVKGMDDLAEHFDEKCNIIEESGSACLGSLADEKLEINRGDDIKEVVSLGQQMEYFRNLYDKKTRRLRNLWLQYRSVQQQIMELAVVVLEEDQVLVTFTEVKQEEDAREDQHAQVPKQSPVNNDNYAGIDEVKALEEHRIFQSCYSTALSELDDMKDQVAKVAEDVLEENKQIVKDMQKGHQETKKKIKGAMDMIRVNT